MCISNIYLFERVCSQILFFYQFIFYGVCNIHGTNSLGGVHIKFQFLKYMVGEGVQCSQKFGFHGGVKSFNGTLVWVC